MDVWLRHFLVHLRKDCYAVFIVKLGSDAKVSCRIRTPVDGAAVWFLVLILLEMVEPRAGIGEVLVLWVLNLHGLVDFIVVELMDVGFVELSLVLYILCKDFTRLLIEEINFILILKTRNCWAIARTEFHILALNFLSEFVNRFLCLLSRLFLGVTKEFIYVFKGKYIWWRSNVFHFVLFFNFVWELLLLLLFRQLLLRYVQLLEQIEFLNFGLSWVWQLLILVCYFYFWGLAFLLFLFLFFTFFSKLVNNWL